MHLSTALCITIAALSAGPAFGAPITHTDSVLTNAPNGLEKRFRNYVDPMDRTKKYGKEEVGTVNTNTGAQVAKTGKTNKNVQFGSSSSSSSSSSSGAGTREAEASVKRPNQGLSGLGSYEEYNAGLQNQQKDGPVSALKSFFEGGKEEAVTEKSAVSGASSSSRPGALLSEEKMPRPASTGIGETEFNRLKAFFEKNPIAGVTTKGNPAKLKTTKEKPKAEEIFSDSTVNKLNKNAKNAAPGNANGGAKKTYKFTTFGTTEDTTRKLEANPFELWGSEHGTFQYPPPPPGHTYQEHADQPQPKVDANTGKGAPAANNKKEPTNKKAPANQEATAANQGAAAADREAAATNREATAANQVLENGGAAQQGGGARKVPSTVDLTAAEGVEQGTRGRLYDRPPSFEETSNLRGEVIKKTESGGVGAKTLVASLLAAAGGVIIGDKVTEALEIGPGFKEKSLGINDPLHVVEAKD